MTRTPIRRFALASVVVAALASVSACSAPDPLDACVVSANEMSAITGWVVEDLTTSPLDAFADAYGAAPTDCWYDVRYDENVPLTTLPNRPVAIESLEISQAVPTIRDHWFTEEGELGDGDILTFRPDWGTDGQIVEYGSHFQARFEFDGRLWSVYTSYLGYGDLLYFGLDPNTSDNYRDTAVSLLDTLVNRILTSAGD